MTATPLSSAESGSEPSAGILHLSVVASRGSSDVPLRYLEREGRLYLLARDDARPRWVDHLLASPGTARWRVLGKEYIGRASLRADRTELAAVLDGFVSQFGAASVEEWFGKSVSCVSLQPIGEIPDDYARLVRLSFDALADDYDSIV